MTENVQMASTMDLLHSSRMECMDSEGGRLIGLRCLSRLGRGAVSSGEERRWRGENNEDFVPDGWVQP